MTIRKPRGRMTKPLVTPYRVGDRVMLTADNGLDELQGRARIPRPGERGTIRRISISDPDDGDATFLVFDVRFGRRIVPLGADEIAPATEANLWLLRQLSTLQIEEEDA